MSKELLNNLFELNGEESDEDEEDVDYKPEKEVVTDDSCSEPEGEEEITNGQKTKKHNKNSCEPKEQDLKQELTEEEFKEKSESLWDEFCKDTKQTDSNVSKSAEISVEPKQTVTKTYEFAGQEVSVTQEIEDKSLKTDIESFEMCSKSGPSFGLKRSSGLGSVLSQLKKPKLNTLEKSFVDWRQYKKEEGIEDELSQHNKSKNTFTERQAFLQRTDLRQFELEKRIREKERSQRNLSKD